VVTARNPAAERLKRSRYLDAPHAGMSSGQNRSQSSSRPELNATNEQAGVSSSIYTSPLLFSLFSNAKIWPEGVRALYASEGAQSTSSAASHA
jgi:hypothetical protein